MVCADTRRTSAGTRPGGAGVSSSSPRQDGAAYRSGHPGRWRTPPGPPRHRRPPPRTTPTGPGAHVAHLTRISSTAAPMSFETATNCLNANSSSPHISTHTSRYSAQSATGAPSSASTSRCHSRSFTSCPPNTENRPTTTTTATSAAPPPRVPAAASALGHRDPLHRSWRAPYGCLPTHHRPHRAGFGAALPTGSRGHRLKESRSSSDNVVPRRHG